MEQEVLNTLFPNSPVCPFDNEYKIQLSLHSQPDFTSKAVGTLKFFKLDTSHKSNADSDVFREMGNRLFRSNKTVNALSAARCYTNAILAALDGSRSLALAHANRSAAIGEFGYYKEAYEDCQCAIDYGYPEENLQKIIVRQAYCANKLKDHNKLKACVEKLRTMTLSEPFAKQKAVFEKDLDNLKEDNGLNKNTTRMDSYLEQKIGAFKDIDKGENICIGKLFSFVPLECSKICSNCAAQNIIPFPCNVCSKVYYCSLKCKRDHAMVHRFECFAYRCNFLVCFGDSYLALNTLINGLPSILPSLQNCTSHLSIWDKIETIAKSGDGGYADVLSLVTNIEFMNWEVIKWHSVSAGLLTYYLKEFTAFFTLFDGCAAGIFDWDIIVSSLLLRHCNQMIAYSTLDRPSICIDNSFEFSALTDIWSSPQHVKKGLLLKISTEKQTHNGINPYTRIWKHSCSPSVTTKFDGENVSAISLQPIRKGAEIFNAYIVNCRHYQRSDRHSFLKIVYHFDCKCEYCLTNNDDVEFFKFHKYRCQSSKCKAIFSPPREKVCFWNDLEQINFLTCPVCGVNFSLEWYWKFKRLCADRTQLREILAIVKFSERLLVGFNELRQRMSLKVVEAFFISWSAGLQISRDEFKEIGKVLNYALSVCEQRNEVESNLYAFMSIMALELMAQGYFLDFDCKKINESLKMLPTEMKIIFDNYIQDYIGDKFKT